MATKKSGTKGKSNLKARAATAEDAQIAMQLYDLRREPEMRKARKFINFEFWPRTFDEFITVASDMTSQHNAYLRQVTTYWEMAASLVARGAFHPQVFFDWCGESFFVYAKFKPLLKEIRAGINPAAFANVEAVINMLPEAQERVKAVEKRLAERYPQSAQAAGKR